MILLGGPRLPTPALVLYHFTCKHCLRISELVDIPYLKKLAD